jgi:hypothetical protein
MKAGYFTVHRLLCLYVSGNLPSFEVTGLTNLPASAQRPLCCPGKAFSTDQVLFSGQDHLEISSVDFLVRLSAPELPRLII